jgi:hypothetical protein
MKALGAVIPYKKTSIHYKISDKKINPHNRYLQFHIEHTPLW